MKTGNSINIILFSVSCIISSRFAVAGIVGMGPSRTLSTIDQSTAAITPLGDPTGIDTITLGCLAIDTINHSYIVKGQYTGESMRRLFTIDIQTGAIVSDPVFSDPYAFSQFEFDSPTPIPVPAANCLLCIGLFSIMGIMRKFRTRS
jgi:hypothetical protein